MCKSLHKLTRSSLCDNTQRPIFLSMSSNTGIFLFLFLESDMLNPWGSAGDSARVRLNNFCQHIKIKTPVYSASTSGPAYQLTYLVEARSKAFTYDGFCCSANDDDSSRNPLWFWNRHESGNSQRSSGSASSRGIASGTSGI